MYTGPINSDNPNSNTVESIRESGVKISSYLNISEELICDLYRFEHVSDGLKYAVIFYDGREPVDFTHQQDAEDFAEDSIV
jgi:hypothetical protein